jgi:hypothetical protein
MDHSAYDTGADGLNGHLSTENLGTSSSDNMEPTKYALITVQIRLVDMNKTIAIGGPPDQATAFSERLAELMHLPTPKEGGLLCLSLEKSDFTTCIMPLIDEEFRNLGWCAVDESDSQLWNKFPITFDPEITDITDELVDTIKVLVETLRAEADKWGLEGSIGAVVGNTEPKLRVAVVPDEKRVYVDQLPPGTEMPTKLSPSPYSEQTFN